MMPLSDLQNSVSLVLNNDVHLLSTHPRIWGKTTCPDRRYMCTPSQILFVLDSLMELTNEMTLLNCLVRVYLQRQFSSKDR